MRIKQPAKKIILLISGLALAAGAVAAGSLAFFTDRGSIANTFMVGDVSLDLDEAAVDEEGELVLDDNGEPADRVKSNEYHLLPGKTYVKDPTLTVKAESEEAYLRIMVTVNCMEALDKIFAADKMKDVKLEDIFGGYDPETWLYAGATRDAEADTITYEFRYKEAVEGDREEDIVLPPLFETMTVPEAITMAQLETLEDFEISLEGHGIQTASFKDDEETGLSAEDQAWQSFTEQLGTDKEETGSQAE